MKKRAASFFLLVLLVLWTPSVQAQPQGRDDSGAYVYFGGLLNMSVSALHSVLDGNTSLEGAVRLWNATNITYSAVLVYGLRGPVAALAGAFNDLGRGVYLISLGAAEFTNYTRAGDYADAGSAVLLVEEGYALSRRALTVISSVRLSVNGSEKTLPTDSLNDALNRVGSLISEYHSILSSRWHPSSLVVFSSKESPYVFENVTFFGYAPNMSTVRLWVGDRSFTLKVSNGTFSMTYAFSDVGTYEVYAVGVNSTGTFKSNILRIRVSRIPTRIVASEKRERKAVVVGYVLDAWGRGVPNATVFVVAGKVYKGLTGANGSFRITVHLNSTVNGTVAFLGNSFYGPSTLVLPLVPAKSPLLIKVSSSFDPLSGALTLKGTLSPKPDYPITLGVYVDGKRRSEVTVSGGKFEVRLKLGGGEHEVYVLFPGDDNYLPAKSNVLDVTVSSTSYVARLLGLAALVIVAFIVYRRVRGGKKVPAPEAVPEVRTEEGPGGEVPKSVREVYLTVYRALLRLLHLPPSVTPRELLSRFQGSGLYPRLKALTVLHEREVYAGVRMKANAVKGALKAAANLIVSLFVGEEL
ncbi:hypothetical protein [Thermococcus henrietii]|uniref:hypothetical protein n=1 Tax=Thermococcus henrietii TaxID=2016361 RepID=UPI000C08B2FC|nr:hypothetical protein [Thermococcus henrietii]